MKWREKFRKNSIVYWNIAEKAGGIFPGEAVDQLITKRLSKELRTGMKSCL